MKVFPPSKCLFLSLNAQQQEKFQEATDEVRTLLAMVRDEKNQGTMEHQPAPFFMLLQQAVSRLAIFDPKYGDDELIKAFAVEVAKLRALSR